MKKIIATVLATTLGFASMGVALAEDNCGGSNTDVVIVNKSGQNLNIYSTNWGNGVSSTATTANSQKYLANGDSWTVGKASQNCATGYDGRCSITINHVLAASPSATTCSANITAQFYNQSNSGWMGGDKRCTGMMASVTGPVQMDSNQNPVGTTCGGVAYGSYKFFSTATADVIEILPPGSN